VEPRTVLAARSRAGDGVQETVGIVAARRAAAEKAGEEVADRLGGLRPRAGVGVAAQYALQEVADAATSGRATACIAAANQLTQQAADPATSGRSRARTTTAEKLAEEATDPAGFRRRRG